MASDSQRGLRVVLVAKQQSGASREHAIFTTSSCANQDRTSLSCFGDTAKTTERNSSVLRDQHWDGEGRRAANDGISSAGRGHEEANPTLGAAFSGSNTDHENADIKTYPIFVGERVVDSTGSTDSNVERAILQDSDGAPASATSLHFFIDRNLPLRHLAVLQAFARKLGGTAPPSSSSRVGTPGSASPPASHHELPSKNSRTSACLHANTVDTAHGDRLHTPSCKAQLPSCRPVALWFLKGELGEGLKCRRALAEVQNALLFGTPSSSRAGEFVIPFHDSSLYLKGGNDGLKSDAAVPPGLPAGGQAKDLVQRAPLDRRSVVFAVGGGSVCDLVGFAASTVLRGVSCVLVPTTLLSAVDAAVGGKNGIDVATAKNCLGTFCHPRAVLVHLPFLRSLSPRHFANGMAEVIKIATTSSPELFDFLARVDPAALQDSGITSSACSSALAPDEVRPRKRAHKALCGDATSHSQAHRRGSTDNLEDASSWNPSSARHCPPHSHVPCTGKTHDSHALGKESQELAPHSPPQCSSNDGDASGRGACRALEKIVVEAIQLKAAVVADDFREGGKRQILNFGHTVGHGIEMLFRSSDWLHGECVAVGMVLELLLLRLLGHISPVLGLRLQLLLRKFSLPCSVALSAAEAQQASQLIISHDKKNCGGKVFVTHVEDVGVTHPRHVVAVPQELLCLVLSPVLALAPVRWPSALCSAPNFTNSSSPLGTVVSVPGSKSVANRALLLAALRHCIVAFGVHPLARDSLGEKQFMLRNLPCAVDVVVMLDALRQLGLFSAFEITSPPDSPSFDVKVEAPPLSCPGARDSVSAAQPFDPLALLDVSDGRLLLWVGDSGTTSRFLLPAAAFLLRLHHCVAGDREVAGAMGKPTSRVQEPDGETRASPAGAASEDRHRTPLKRTREEREEAGFKEAATRGQRKEARAAFSCAAHACAVHEGKGGEPQTQRMRTTCSGGAGLTAPVVCAKRKPRGPKVQRIVVDGGEQLRRRPMGALADALSGFIRGCRVRYLAADGCLPVELSICDDLAESGRQDSPATRDNAALNSAAPPVLSRVFTEKTDWRVSASESSQFGSALMMLAPLAPHDVVLHLEVPEMGTGDRGSDLRGAPPPDPASAAAAEDAGCTRLRRYRSSGAEGVSRLPYAERDPIPCPSGNRLCGGLSLLKPQQDAAANEDPTAPSSVNGSPTFSPTVTPFPFVLMTQRLMRQWGFDVAQTSSVAYQVCSVWRRRGGRGGAAAGCEERAPLHCKAEPAPSLDDSLPEPTECTVEADATAASYFVAMAAAAGDRVHLNLDRSKSLQGDAAFVDVLPLFGCSVKQSYGCPRRLFPETPGAAAACCCLATCPAGGAHRPDAGTADVESAAQSEAMCACCSGAWLTVEGPPAGLQKGRPRGPHAGLETPLPPAGGSLAKVAPVTVDVSSMQDCFMTCAVLAAIACQGSQVQKRGKGEACVADERRAVTLGSEATSYSESATGDPPRFRLIAGRTARLKETDRIAVTTRGLKAAGFIVAELPDGLLIYQTQPLAASGSNGQGVSVQVEEQGRQHNRVEVCGKERHNGHQLDARRGEPSPQETQEFTVIESEADHRVAMSFAIIAMLRQDIGIHDWRCVDKTFADFWFVCKERLGMRLYAPPAVPPSCLSRRAGNANRPAACVAGECEKTAPGYLALGLTGRCREETREACQDFTAAQRKPSSLSDTQLMGCFVPEPPGCPSLPFFRKTTDSPLGTAALREGRVEETGSAPHQAVSRTARSASPDVLVVVGMRGVGKSVLGQLAALERGWPLVDLDVLLEAWLRNREEPAQATPADAYPPRTARGTAAADSSLAALKRLRMFIEDEGMPAFRHVESQALAFLLASLRGPPTKDCLPELTLAEATSRARSSQPACADDGESVSSIAIQTGHRPTHEAKAGSTKETQRFPSDTSLDRFLRKCRAEGLLASRNGGCVISCGGGVIEGYRAMELLAAEPLVVWVKTSEQESVDRALRKEGQAPSFFQPQRKHAEAGRASGESAAHEAKKRDHSASAGNVSAQRATYREKVTRLYRERSVRYKQVAKFEFWTPPIRELLAGLQFFENEFSSFPMLSELKTSESSFGPFAGVAADSVAPPASGLSPASSEPFVHEDHGRATRGRLPPRSRSSAALSLPELPEFVAARLAASHPEEAPKLTLYLRAVYTVWQLFLSALLGPPVPLTPSSTFLVCDELVRWSTRAEETETRLSGAVETVDPHGAAAGGPAALDCASEGAGGSEGFSAAKRRAGLGALDDKTLRWLQASRDVDAVELRADCLASLESVERQAFFLRLITGKPLILTVRSEQDGGHFGPGDPLFEECLSQQRHELCDGAAASAERDSAEKSSSPPSAALAQRSVEPAHAAKEPAPSEHTCDGAASASAAQHASSGDARQECTRGASESCTVSPTVQREREREAQELSRTAVYIDALSRMRRLVFDWIDIEVTQVARLRTPRERRATAAREALWERVVCRVRAGGRGESEQVEASQHAAAVLDVDDDEERDASETVASSTESVRSRARRAFLQILRDTPSGARYIASLHGPWSYGKDADPLRTFNRHYLCSVACSYAALSKIVIVPQLPPLGQDCECTAEADAGAGEVSAEEDARTRQSSVARPVNGGGSRKAEKVVEAVVRAVRSACAAGDECLYTITRLDADEHGMLISNSRGTALEGSARVLNRPLILLQGGPAGRHSRIENSYFTPTCLEGEDDNNVYGQLSAASLWRRRRDLALPCVRYFIFGYPTTLSPSPTIHNAIFQCRTATAKTCLFSHFPSVAVQRELESLLCPSAGGQPVQDVTGLARRAKQSEKSLMSPEPRPSVGNGLLATRENERRRAELIERMTWQFLRSATSETFGGACVTIPLKEVVAPLLSRIDPIAKRIGAVNTIYRDKASGLCGTNTDYAAIVKAILSRCNRVGTVPGTARCELPQDVFRNRPLVVEMAYSPVLTPLVKKACGAGCAVVHGIELFVWQALIQARLWVEFQEGALNSCGETAARAQDCLAETEDEYQKELIKKWMASQEGRSSRPLDLHPADMCKVVKQVEDFYRARVDKEHLVTLRAENFLL
ncbi:hypothetical protein BESB_070320 [Besnoitia besnoiti]|uniref:Uncharacterized protein n=1 Tax=Besnoitia besnoiti TaxID=94643 RepID=A0A2A9MET5_BESBE|nr:uncharacterized protein BESB_070320 [Besnoitia besnoiti]PFH33880.1 hypothetical protein BESB_070320 [Besnoitia besnoiti]